MSDAEGDRWLSQVLARDAPGADDADDAYRADEAALLLVEGAAGTGRSRLARRLLAAAEAGGARTVTVTCTPFGASVTAGPGPGPRALPTGRAPQGGGAAAGGRPPAPGGGASARAGSGARSVPAAAGTGDGQGVRATVPDRGAGGAGAPPSAATGTGQAPGAGGRETRTAGGASAPPSAGGTATGAPPPADRPDTRAAPGAPPAGSPGHSDTGPAPGTPGPRPTTGTTPSPAARPAPGTAATLPAGRPDTRPVPAEDRADAPAGAHEPAAPPALAADTPPPLTGAALREALAVRLAAAREGRGGGGTDAALLVVEDVHLADRAALDLLRRLLADPPARLAVVLTYRPEELREPGLALGRGAALPAGLAVRRLRLAPFDAGQVRALVEEELGPDCGPADLFTRIAHGSGGVPQIVVDLVRLLRETGEPRERYTARDLEAVGVPPRLAQLALARTAALSAQVRPVAWAAAVLGEPVEAEELTAVAGLSGESGTRALVSALRTGVLTEDASGRYGFFVPLAATAVYDEVPGPVRRQLHRSAAHVLGHRRPVPWPALARHRRHGGEVRGWLHAVEQAAQESAAAGDHQAAVDLLEQTLSRPTVPLSARARLAPLLAHSAVLGLRSEQTVTVLRQILDEQSLPAAVRGQIRLDLGLLLCNQAVAGVQGWLELQRAVEELQEKPVMAARAMAALAMPLLSTVPLERNLHWLERAEKAGADSGDEEARTAVAANRVGTLMYVGDPAAWQALEALPRDTTDPTYQQHVARGLCNAADGALWLGELGPARELLAEGLELATRSGAAYVEEGARGTRLLLDWAEGEWADLPSRARAFTAEAETMPGMAVDGRIVLGMLALSKGEWQQATAWLTGEGPRDANGSAVPHLAAASGALIRMALVRDDVESAVGEASGAWDRVRDKGVWVWAAELAPWAVEATLRAGRHATARNMIGEYAAGLEGRQAPASDAALLWCRALLAEAEGEHTRAAELFRKSALVYAGLPRPYAVVLATEGAARCLLAAGGDTGTAVAELTSCVERLTELGAVWDAARVRALLRAHQPAAEGHRPRGRPSYGDRLSPREQEVADLAATGLTNKEIAATLHLSPRTVEQHVARARRKLESQSGQTLPRGRGRR
ncbi:LuxR C-terminal-related transcriptional regulator [Streptomyces sp. NPDC005805]|uniref:LuxR C-terminal-related transcriptional regulator n=1 Tax=Streptomyces sp. NPDC005805 TaxID=3157068 RepID=UPI0033CF530B